MNAYQKIVELRNEIERLTGFRPHIELHFHELTNEEAQAARDTIAASSEGRMESYVLDWTDGARTQNFYRAEDLHERIYLVAYGQMTGAEDAAS